MKKQFLLMTGLTLAGFAGVGSARADGEPNPAYDAWDIAFVKVDGKVASGKYWNGSSYSTFKATAGRFTMDPLESFVSGSQTYADANFFSYCTDIGMTLRSNWDYKPGTFAGQDGVFPIWRDGGITDAAYIYNMSFNSGWSVDTDAEYSGMQLAIWELLYDAPTDAANNYGLTDGSSKFSLTKYDNDALESAKHYIQWLLDAKNSQSFVAYDNTWLQPIDNEGHEGGSQGLLYRNRVRVPDAGSTMGLLGASSLGLMILSRKKKK